MEVDFSSPSCIMHMMNINWQSFLIYIYMHISCCALHKYRLTFLCDVEILSITVEGV